MKQGINLRRTGNLLNRAGNLQRLAGNCPAIFFAVSLFNRGERIDANADVVLPAAIPGHLKFWEPELLKLPRTHAMVHSKVVVIDPYGANPVVMTGSHNMGPKASGVNDENLIVIQGNRDLASQYAGKIMDPPISCREHRPVLLTRH
jgi:phosphatidylserine/phosphatidylglycerophosphate/cardiolipin synthase-like enzyme